MTGTGPGGPLPTAAALLAALDATWPPAARHRCGPFVLREGRGGGKRVSAATLEAADFAPADIDAAEAAMAALGQAPLFMLRPDSHPADAALDAALAARGHRLVDPVVGYGAPVAAWAGSVPPPVSAFWIWPPLRVMEEVWDAAGIGAARRAVMDRVPGPHTSILARSADRVAGAAFVALDGPVAMLHALEVLPHYRRQGSAVNMLRVAGRWAQDNGATVVSAMVAAANGPARALYASLGMQNVGNYHYRAPRP